MSRLSRETCPSNLKSAALTIFELLVFNTQKIRESHDPGHAHFRDCSQNIFLQMLRGSYVPNLVKIGPKLSSQSWPLSPGGRTPDGWTDTGRWSGFIFCPMLNIALDRQKVSIKWLHWTVSEQSVSIYMKTTTTYTTLTMCSHFLLCFIMTLKSPKQTDITSLHKNKKFSKADWPAW